MINQSEDIVSVTFFVGCTFWKSYIFHKLRFVKCYIIQRHNFITHIIPLADVYAAGLLCGINYTGINNTV